MTNNTDDNTFPEKLECQAGSTWVNIMPILWRLYGVTKNDEKTWLGDFGSEAEITGIANFFANNPHFEHMEIYEGVEFRYAVMRIVGGSRD